MKRTVIAMLMVIVGLFAFCQQKSQPKETAQVQKKEAQPAMDKDTLVVFETDMGKIVFEFFPEKAPGHVKNFQELSKNGFYNGTKFHRTVPGFMIQGGDINSKDAIIGNEGTGGPGYSLPAEFNDLHHDKGILSMARSADPNSAGSQFFIMHMTNSGLDGKHTVFGKVVEGMDVVDQIANTPTDKAEQPLVECRMKTVTVETFGYQYTARKIEQP